MPLDNLVIVGDRYTITVGDTLRSGKVSVEPGTSPTKIDFLSAEGPNQGKVLKGIYKIDGDTFTCCIALPDKDRPTAFTSQPGSGHLLYVNQRAKP